MSVISYSIRLGSASLLVTCHRVGLGSQVAGTMLRDPCAHVSCSVPRRQQLYDTSNFACHLGVVPPTLCSCPGLECVVIVMVQAVPRWVVSAIADVMNMCAASQ